MLEDKLLEIAVKIEDTNGNGRGSGVLWAPRKESLYAYVFTAAHVVNSKETQIRLLDDKHQEVVLISQDVKCHSNYSYINDRRENDVAVIRIQNKAWMEKIPNIVFGKDYNHINIIGRGFPQNASDLNFILSGQALKGRISNSISNRFQIKLDPTMSVNQADRDAELEGYSGTGVFHEDRSENELVLLGICTFGQGRDAALGTVNNFSADLISEVCKENNWDLPGYESEAPLSFEPFIDECVSKITTEAIKDEIRYHAQELIENGLTPCSLTKLLNDCNDVPICKRKTRIRCENYWIAMLQFLSIIHIIGITTDGSMGPSIVIEKDGEKEAFPIEFVCSEGYDGNCRIDKLIRSLVLQSLTWGNKLRNNGIIIWSSDRTPTIKLYNRTKFGRIVRDICFEPRSEAKKIGLDLKYGEKAPNDLSVIHIEKLLEELDSIENVDRIDENIKKCIEELFISAAS